MRRLLTGLAIASVFFSAAPALATSQVLLPPSPLEQQGMSDAEIGMAELMSGLRMISARSSDEEAISNKLLLSAQYFKNAGDWDMARAIEDYNISRRSS